MYFKNQITYFFFLQPFKSNWGFFHFKINQIDFLYSVNSPIWFNIFYFFPIRKAIKIAIQMENEFYRCDWYFFTNKNTTLFQYSKIFVSKYLHFSVRVFVLREYKRQGALEYWTLTFLIWLAMNVWLHECYISAPHLLTEAYSWAAPVKRPLSAWLLQLSSKFKTCPPSSS